MSNDLGLDRSGNGNNWTVNNISATDQMVDTPTNNFATLNPLVPSSTLTFSEGNLKTLSGSGAWQHSVSTFSVSEGKWYWEVLYNLSTAQSVMTGIVDADSSTSVSNDDIDECIVYRSNNGYKLVGGSYSSFGATWGSGNIIGVSLDMDSNQVTFYKDNSSQGTLSVTFSNAAPDLMVGDTRSLIANFGQDSSFAGNKTAGGNADSGGVGDFFYEPPANFLALCTANLPDPTVIPSEHFNTVTYQGNGGTQSILGVGFQPDLVWNKRRNGTTNHNLTDSVRGTHIKLMSNNADPEADQSGSDKGTTSFDSDGFTVKDDTAGNYQQNGPSSATFVAWNWKAGSAPTTDNLASAGATPTAGSVKINGSNLGSALAGSIAATRLSANTDAGFSVITYTGTGSNATIGHGLSKAPDMWVVKPRTNVSDNQWFVCHKGLDPTNHAQKFIHFDTNGATQDNNLMWNDTLPTATTIALGSKPGTNNSGGSFVAYAWHSVDGYSKIGSYVGNSSTDGTYVYCGFTPAYVLTKQSSSGTGWWKIADTERSKYNGTWHDLYANNNGAEGVDDVNTAVDILSNGFKLRMSHTAHNGSGQTYIFLAFAESPFKHSNAR